MSTCKLVCWNKIIMLRNPSDSSFRSLAWVKTVGRRTPSQAELIRWILWRPVIFTPYITLFPKINTKWGLKQLRKSFRQSWEVWEEITGPIYPWSLTDDLCLAPSRLDSLPYRDIPRSFLEFWRSCCFEIFALSHRLFDAGWSNRPIRQQLVFK